ncbi:MAG: ferritin-like domain-containing protein [Propionibacteriaceae bacterium]|jgi:hypothetical protein|nr:ferritin-like domain-containing protein [Propionibacteriaceae bacterium]
MPARRVSWPLIGLVVVVVLALGGVVANLTGWFDDPAMAGAPRPTYSPPVLPAPDGAAEAAETIVPIWETLAGAAQGGFADDGGAQYQRLADTLAVQWRVLTGPNPLGRIDPGEGLPGTPAAVYGADQVSLVLPSLEALRALEWDYAAATADPMTAAWWAGLAGAADQVWAGVQGSYAAPPLLDPLVTLAPTDDPTAAATLEAAYHEAVYVTSAALGRLSKGAAYNATLATLNRLKADRDSLEALGQANGWELPVAAAAYVLPALDTDEAALDAVGTAVRAVSEAAGAWLGSTTASHDQALAALRSAAQMGAGYASAVWVGWPD